MLRVRLFPVKLLHLEGGCVAVWQARLFWLYQTLSSWCVHSCACIMLVVFCSILALHFLASLCYLLEPPLA